MKTEINFDGYGKFFLQQIRLEFKGETSEVLHLAHSFVWYWNLDTWESGSEYIMWCWRRMEISYTDRVRNEEVLRRVKEKNVLSTVEGRKEG